MAPLCMQTAKQPAQRTSSIHSLPDLAQSLQGCMTTVSPADSSCQSALITSD